MFLGSVLMLTKTGWGPVFKAKELLYLSMQLVVILTLLEKSRSAVAFIESLIYA